jgi:hypothetical protein
MRLIRFVLVVLLVVAIIPVASPLLAEWLAKANGCRLDERAASACVVAGIDLGPALYSASVLGWLMLVTLPAALVIAAMWLIVEVLGYRRRRRPAA